MKAYPNQWRVLSLMTMAWAFSGLVHNCIAFLFPFFSVTYQLGTEHNGYLTATLAFFWTISILICGKKAERYGQIQVMLPCLSAGALALIGMGVVQQIAVFYLCTAIAGFGCGSICSTSLSFMAEHCDPQRRGLFYGVAMSSFTLVGSAGGSLIFTRLGAIFGWRSCFFLIAALIFLEVLILFFFGRTLSHKQISEQDTVAKPTNRVRDLFAYRNVLISTVLACLVMMWYFTTASYTILYLMESHQFSPVVAGAIFAGFGTGGFLGEFSAPILSDQIGRKRTSFVAAAVGSLCFAAFLFAGLSNAGLTVAIAGAAFFLSGALAILNSVVPSESVPNELVATATAFAPAAGEFMGGMLAPMLAGILSKSLSLETILHMLAILPICTAIGVLFLRETAPKFMAANQKESL